MSTPGAVCRDRWPAHLTSPVGITEPARVVLTDRTDEDPPLMWAWVPESTPRLLARREWLPMRSVVPMDDAGTWTVATPDGNWTVVPGGGCGGCHSVMRTFTPWAPYVWAARMPDGVQLYE